VLIHTGKMLVGWEQEVNDRQAYIEELIKVANKTTGLEAMMWLRMAAKAAKDFADYAGRIDHYIISMGNFGTPELADAARAVRQGAVHSQGVVRARAAKWCDEFFELTK
jgi:hypothetical protein